MVLVLKGVWVCPQTLVLFMKIVGGLMSRTLRFSIDVLFHFLCFGNIPKGFY